MNWKTWVYSIVAAAIGGASSASLSAFAMPDVFNFTHVGLVHLAKAAAIGALIPVFTLLKASPLPAIVTTTQTTTLQTKTVVDPAPPQPPAA
jgi:hypothetical protein